MEKGCEGKVFDIHCRQRKTRKVFEQKTGLEEIPVDEEMERKRLEAKPEQQREKEHHLSELCLGQEEQERRMWQEKFEAELEATHRRLELEKDTRSTTAKFNTEIENNAVQEKAYRLGEI